MVNRLLGGNPEKAKAVKGPRLLGKWDYIGCAVVAVVTSPGVLSGRLEGIESALGRFIAVLVIWGFLKVAVTWDKQKADLGIQAWKRAT